MVYNDLVHQMRMVVIVEDKNLDWLLLVFVEEVGEEVVFRKNLMKNVKYFLDIVVVVVEVMDDDMNKEEFVHLSK